MDERRNENTSSEYVLKLVEGLHHERSDIAAQCAQILGARREHQATQALQEALITRRWEIDVARAAAWALGQIGDPGVVPALRFALGDAPLPVRLAIVEALAGITSEEARELLFTLAEEDPSALLRARARSYLSGTRDRTASTNRD